MLRGETWNYKSTLEHGKGDKEGICWFYETPDISPKMRVMNIGRKGGERGRDIEKMTHLR